MKWFTFFGYSLFIYHSARTANEPHQWTEPYSAVSAELAVYWFVIRIDSDRPYSVGFFYKKKTIRKL